MKIPNHRELKRRADNALARAREPKKTILAYAGIVTLLGLVMTILSVYLDRQISGTGGLANLGQRSILSTLQAVMPLAQMVLLMCLELGYCSAAMRFARGQYADHTDLRTGFRLFGPLLRMNLIQAAMYLGILFASIWIGTQLFIFTPFATPLLETITPLLESAAELDAAAVTELYQAMLPMMVFVLVIFAVLAALLMFRYRMASFLLVDKPQEGAIAAMRNSRWMMKGNCLGLFKLDLSFWWYYLLTFLATVLCYGDQILPLLGVQLPMPDMVSYFLFYGLYLAAQFAIFYFFLNRVEVTYVAAYDAIRPEESTGGAVLGSIFDMQ